MKNLLNTMTMLIILFFFTSCPTSVMEISETHTVIFESNSGSLVTKQIVLDGNKVIKPVDPIKSSFTFNAWFEDSTLEQEWTFSEKIYSDLILYADWTPVPYYTVSFNSDNEVVIPEQVILEGNYIERPENPTKEGYIFTNWYTDYNNSNMWFFYDDIVTDDIILYAGWTSLPIFNVVFNCNSNSVIEGQNVIQGETIQKPNDPSKEGYIFKYWYSDYDLAYLWDFTNNIYDDVNLYASWEKLTYTISFYIDSSSNISDRELDYGDIIYEPIDPDKSGYTFSGWYSDEDLLNKWDFDNVVTSDLTLYASWEPLTQYSVVYITNAITTIPDALLYKGENVTKPSDPIKDDYRFYNWYRDENLTIIWDFSNDKVVSDIILYAKYTKIGVVSPSGGYIFFDDEEDGIDDLPGIRFLEAAPIDYDTELVWGKFDNVVVGADGTALGTGAQNSLDIITADDTPDKAADACSTYTIINNGVTYSDWYLPSIDELNLIYTNLKQNNLGGLESEWYWSSSESSALKSWTFAFGSGSSYLNSKNVSNYIRPVRSY